jgi:hypothetical protein
MVTKTIDTINQPGKLVAETSADATEGAVVSTGDDVVTTVAAWSSTAAR